MSKFWHGFADMHVVADHEVVLESGDGATITDTTGKTYIDATAALWFCNVGYGRREIADAVAERVQLGDGLVPAEVREAAGRADPDANETAALR